MTTQPLAADAVATEVTVKAPIERAFDVFTNRMDTWWPAAHHLVEGELERMVVETRPGGRIYDVATNGNECCWAHVLAYEPPERFVFSWDIGLDWTLEPDAAKRSEVHVSFIADGPDRTRVVLEHRELHRHGDGWERMRDSVGSDDGWGIGMRAFAQAASTT